MEQIIEQYFDLSVMFDPEFFDEIVEGFYFTLKLSLLSGVLSLLWGLVLALMRQAPGRAGALLRAPAIAYIDLFRAVPALLTILIVSLSLGALNGDPLPQFLAVPDWFGQIAPFWYGVFAITLTYGAYMAEVYRAGIEAVPGGQMEAARSLGMSHRTAMRYVIVPQAVRKVIPPLLNDFIALMKDTTLVSVIGLPEVVQTARDVQSETLNSSGLMLGAIFFVLVTIPLARLLDLMIARQRERYQRAGA